MSNAARRDAPPRNYAANHAAGTLGGCRRGRRAGAGAELPVHLEQRWRVVADHLQLGDDFPADLLFLDLLGEEPLQLGDRREGLFVERRLVQRVDLVADFLLLLERALEYVEH